MTSNFTPDLPSEPIRGPRQLLEWLVPQRPAAASLHLGLDCERRVVRVSRHELTAGLPAAWPAVPGVEQWVVVCVCGAPVAESTLATARTWRQPAEGRLLDLLVTDGARWWSALCDDLDCCPAQGRELDLGAADHRAVVGWQAALGGETPADLLALVAALSDVQLRDALLVALSDAGMRRVWRELFPSLERAAREQGSSPRAHAALLTADSTARFLDGETALAHQLATAAQELVPDYSYARLLLTALESEAPAALLLGALQSAARTLPDLSAAACSPAPA